MRKKKSKKFKVIYAQTVYHALIIDASCEEEAYERTLHLDIQPSQDDIESAPWEFVEVLEVIG